MRIYKSVFFWLGGVLLETVPELTLAQLVPDVKGHEGVRIRQQLRHLSEELSLGNLSSTAYCEQALSLCGSKMPASALERTIIESASLRQPIAALIEQIPETYECWLVVDYPKEWYEALGGLARPKGARPASKRSEQRALHTLFPEQQIVFTSDLELVRMVPDVFYRLPQKAGRLMEDCIAIDPQSARAVAAMKHGLASIIYVYPERLKLELALQDIWRTDADVMHPASSERIDF